MAPVYHVLVSFQDATYSQAVGQVLCEYSTFGIEWKRLLLLNLGPKALQVLQMLSYTYTLIMFNVQGWYYV